MRQDADAFSERDTLILVFGPEGTKKFVAYFKKNNLPFRGIPDPKHKILNLYGQQFKLFKFGRMPAQVIVDKNGHARYVHYGNSMSDIPTNQTILGLIDEMSTEPI